VAYLEERGFSVRLGCFVDERQSYLAGTDEQRCADLNDMLRDPEISGICLARGGYGAMRLLEKLDYDAVRRQPKLLIGMSDVTALQLSLFNRCGLVTLAGPMIAGQVGKGLDELSAQWLVKGLTEPLAARDLFDVNSDLRVLRPGQARGCIVGGCLSLVTALLGTEFSPDYSETILFLEEVHESLYRVDRMLTQLRLAGVFDVASAIICGHFLGPGGKRLDRDVDKVLLDLTRGRPLPIVAGFPHGHTLPNVTIPHGIPVELNTDSMTLIVTDAGIRQVLA
jgi:muramoyltetrapeptide carboxypeptidase